MPSFADRLADAVRRKGPLCVGIDPRWESLPKSIRDRHQAYVNVRDRLALTDFGIHVLNLIAPYCGVVKPQAAFFEQAGIDGFEALKSLMTRAKEMGFVTILDAKRGD